MTPTTDQIRVAVATLAAAGMRIQAVERDGPLGLRVRRAAQRLDVSPSWIRKHLPEFPNAFLVGSEMRIPVSDLRKFMERHRVFKPGSFQLANSNHTTP